MLKGGFGKSVFASTLGGVLGDEDYRGHDVLVVDLDPQGHLSTGLGYYNREKDGALDLGDVLLGDADPADIIKHPGHGFDFVPSLNLEDVADELSKSSVLGSDLKLKNELVDPLLGDAYDYILVDTPGTRSKLTNNAVVAAPNGILPLKAAPEALNGMRETATKLVSNLRESGIDFDILAAVPNELSERLDQETADKWLLKSMNTDEAFAAMLLAGRSGDVDAGEIPADRDVDEVLDEHVPPFARIRRERWEAIESGDVDTLPKPGIRSSSTVKHAYHERVPVTAYDAGDSPPVNHERLLADFEVLADLVETGEMPTTARRDI